MVLTSQMQGNLWNFSSAFGGLGLRDAILENQRCKFGSTCGRASEGPQGAAWRDVQKFTCSDPSSEVVLEDVTSKTEQHYCGSLGSERAH